MRTILQFILFISISLTIVSTALGQGLKVKSVNEDLTEVVLIDTETKGEFIAILDDEINGWRVVDITQDYVIIAKTGEGETPLVKKLPVTEVIRSGTTIVN